MRYARATADENSVELEEDEDDEEDENYARLERRDDKNGEDIELRSVKDSEMFRKKERAMADGIDKFGAEGYMFRNTVLIVSIMASGMLCVPLALFLTGRVAFFPSGPAFYNFAFVFVVPAIPVFVMNFILRVSESLITTLIVFLYNAGAMILTGYSAASALYRSIMIDPIGLVSLTMTLSLLFSFMILLVVAGMNAYLLRSSYEETREEEEGLTRK